MAQRLFHTYQRDTTVRPHRPLRRVAALLFMGTSLLGMTVLLVWAIRLGYQLVVNPASVRWIERFVPGWMSLEYQGPEPERWSAIAADVQQSGLELGQPLILSHSQQAEDSRSADFLLPILKAKPNCPKDCQQIVELRAYRPVHTSIFSPGTERTFVLLDQIPITGPEEFFVLAPRNEALDIDGGSERRLPLTQVRSLGGEAPNAGVWLTLQGKYQQGGDPILYGQVVYYDPRQSRLGLMLGWTSPAQQRPRWQELSGVAPPELMVDQTIGLEPNLKAYRLIDSRSGLIPQVFEAISLTDPELSHAAYQNALRLAQVGLWSDALRSLQPLAQSMSDTADWSESVEAQFRLIEAHAEITQAQAEQDWSSPSQQLLAYLIDGRWQAALDLFEQSQSSRREMENLLKADSEDLWERVKTTLSINPNQLLVRAWGALLLAMQDDPSTAFAWLQRQPNPSAATATRVRRLLTSPEPTTVTVASTKPEPTAEAVIPSTPLSFPETSRILGPASVVTSINSADWIRPSMAEPLVINPSQNWYQIEVSQFHDGQRWQRSPFTALPPSLSRQPMQLWQRLGLTGDSQIQITAWKPAAQPEFVWATVKAVQLQAGRLRLLAAGAPLSAAARASAVKPFATTTSALQWVALPPTESLIAVNAQDPARVNALMPNLWQELRQTQHVQALPAQTVQATLQQVQDWSVQRMDLTGDAQDEVLLALTSDQLNGLHSATNSTHRLGSILPRTLVFSPAGQLLYSDLGTPQQAVVAIATLSETSFPALVVNQGSSYRFLIWSAQNQRFE